MPTHLPDAPSHTVHTVTHPLHSAGCLRNGAGDVKSHPFFAGVNWDDVYSCRVPAPFVPRIRGARDTSNFDSYPDSDEDTAKRLTGKDAELFTEFEGY